MRNDIHHAFLTLNELISVPFFTVRLLFEHLLSSTQNSTSLYDEERTPGMSHFLADFIKLWPTLWELGMTADLVLLSNCSGLQHEFVWIELQSDSSRWHQNNLSVSIWPPDDQNSALSHAAKTFPRLSSGCFWRCFVLPTLSRLKKRVELLFSPLAHISSRYEQHLTPTPSQEILDSRSPELPSWYSCLALP